VKVGRRTILVPSGLSGRLGLVEGAEIDPEELSRSATEAQTAAAREDAARFVGTAERTAARLGAYLRRRGYLAGVSAVIVGQFVSEGWVDDARYARIYAANRPGLGRRRVAADLAARGVSAEEARKAVSDLDDDAALEALIPVLAKKYGSLERSVALRRAVSFLMRRGFAAGPAFAAAAKALGR